MVVVDANVLVDWYLTPVEDQQAAYAQSFASAMSSGQISTIHAPEHIIMEVAGVLVRRSRDKRQTPKFDQANMLAAMRDLDLLPIEFHVLGYNFEQLAAAATAFNLSVYDAPYLELARVLDVPLVTSDKGLISAANAWHVKHWQLK